MRLWLLVVLVVFSIVGMTSTALATSHDQGKADLNALMQPAVDLARKTYPDARDRFLRGLPPRHAFFVVTRLPVGTDGFEQVFVAVDRIEGDTISGQLSSDVRRAPGYKKGDRYLLSESLVVDWLITRPDGTEEGNYIGKALDRRHRGRKP